MGTPTTLVRAPRRRRRLSNLLALALMVSALLASGVGVSPTASADPAGPAVGPAAFGRGVPPAVNADFPRMPSGCYEADGVTLRDVACRITRYGSTRPTLVAWGDSHTWMYLPALRREARANRVNLTLVVLGSCPAALPLPRSRGFSRSICENHNVRTLQWLTQLHRRLGDDLGVVVGGFWAGYRDAYRRQQEADRAGILSGLTDYQQHMSTLAVEESPRMFARLGRTGIHVDLIGQAATVPDDAPECAAGQEPYQCDLRRDEALSREQDNRRWVERNLMRPLSGRPLLIDATPGYCTASTCLAHVGGANTYYDDIHLGARLARTLTGYFTPVFDALT